VSGTPTARPAPVGLAAVPAAIDQGGETAVRRFVTVLAVIVGGLCFLFSAGNVYQLAVDLQLWVWIRPLVAPAVDLSLVALVVGIRFLARRGVSGRELRRPRLFLLAVGLAAWALNTAGAVVERDWGKAAFDSLAPGLLIGWAEVLPWFLRQFRAVTQPTVPAVPGAPLPVVASMQPAGTGEPAPATAPSPGQSVTVPAVPAAAPPPGSGNGAHPARGNQPRAVLASRAGATGTGTARAAPATAPGRSGEPDADGVMRAWWAAERAAGRTPSGAELDRICGRDPRNGSGRKARARYLREEAAGRFWTPQPDPGPTAAQGASAPAPDGATTVGTTHVVPAAQPAGPDPVSAVDAMTEREPTRPGPAPAVLGDGDRQSSHQPLSRSATAPARREAR
jgi:hypothetical protein